MYLGPKRRRPWTPSSASCTMTAVLHPSIALSSDEISSASTPTFTSRGEAAAVVVDHPQFCSRGGTHSTFLASLRKQARTSIPFSARSSLWMHAFPDVEDAVSTPTRRMFSGWVELFPWPRILRYCTKNKHNSSMMIVISILCMYRQWWTA